MKVTACSIVKNEEKNIARSIESYKDVVDEIIIVDTGSTDNTVDICRSLGAQTFFFEWKDDFSAAKNFALDQATGDWIIFLDADEWFVPKLQKKQFISKLKEFNKLTDGFIVKICEYNSEIDKVIANEVVIRVFKNDSKIRFSGRIHEKIERKDNIKMKLLTDYDLVIYHSGYSSNIINYKAERNLNMLYSLYNEGKIDTPLLFYMFRESYLLNHEDSIKFYNLFMEQSDADHVIKNYSTMICIFEYMYKSMLKKPEKYTNEDVFNLLNTAYNKYPTIPIHCYFLGCEYLKLENYLESHKWINKAIYLNEHYTEKYTNTFVAHLNEAYYNMGFLMQKLEKSDEALNFYIMAIKDANDYNLLKIMMGVFEIIQFEPPEEIILFINNVFDIKSKKVIKNILEVLKNTRLHKVFIYYAIKYNKEFDEQDETTYIAMMLTGKAELAVETAISSYESNKDKELDQIIWHLDYALIGIMYLKDSTLYNRYRAYFNDQTNTIINAYFLDQKLLYMSENMSNEFKKIFNMICNILPLSNIDKFTKIAT